MSNRSCAVPEERIVQFILDRAEFQDMELIQHLERCASCRSLAQDLRATLCGEDGNISRYEMMEPPARMQRRVLLRAKLLQCVRWLIRDRRMRRSYVTISTMVGSILLVIGLFHAWSINEDVDLRLQDMVSKQTVQLISEPGTVRYAEFVGQADQKINGEVWLNGQTGDLLLIVNGVGPLTSSDYQAWMVRHEGKDSMGLLELDHQIGYLYVQGVQSSDVEHILVSMEPKGGSLKPTGPEAIRIHLQP